MHAIDIVKEKFPNVKKVVDANKEITIHVTSKDTQSAKVKQHRECAMAVACKRQLDNCTGAMISLKSAYIVKNEVAYRFIVPESVSREIVSFDRKAGFSAGEYKLQPPSPALKLGSRSGRKYTESRQHKKTGNGMSHRFQHCTDDVRSKLGSKEYRADKS